MKPILENPRPRHPRRAVLAVLQTRVEIRVPPNPHGEVTRDLLERNQTLRGHRSGFQVRLDLAPDGAAVAPGQGGEGVEGRLGEDAVGGGQDVFERARGGVLGQVEGMLADCYGAVGAGGAVAYDAVREVVDGWGMWVSGCALRRMSGRLIWGLLYGNWSRTGEAIVSSRLGIWPALVKLVVLAR